MRCREVKRRLNEIGEFDKELTEHLNNCPSCAEEARLESMLKSVLRSASSNQASYPQTPFEDIKARIVSLSAGKSILEKSFMSKIKTKITDHPGFSFGMVTVAFVFAFILLVPFSYHKTVGYNLEINCVKADDNLQPETLNQVITELGYEDDNRIKLVAEPDDNRLILTNIPTEEAVREMVIALETAKGQDYAFLITPVVEKVSGNIYGQLRDKLVTVKIDGTDKIDKEIAEEIRTILEREGITGSKVTVKTDPNGIRDIFIDIKDSSDTQMAQTQIEFVVGSGEILFSLPGGQKVNMNLEIEGKSAEELELEIRRKLKEKNIDSTEIEVIENQDGQHEIKLRFDKDKKN